jgi:uncharacterized phiE125 gp8 family phage protein
VAVYNLSRIYIPPHYALDRGTPTSEPVTLAEAKEWARIDEDDEDALTTRLIRSAREQVESMTGRALIQREHVLKLPRFPHSDEQVIALPGGQVQSVTSIAYTDQAGASQTLSSANYTVETSTIPAEISLVRGAEWPSVEDISLPVTITYQAGYAPDETVSPTDTAGNVPQALKDAMAYIIAMRTEIREPVAIGVSVASVPDTLHSLLAPYRLHSRFI